MINSFLYSFIDIPYSRIRIPKFPVLAWSLHSGLASAAVRRAGRARRVRDVNCNVIFLFRNESFFFSVSSLALPT
jgi:hypothetical protein